MTKDARGAALPVYAPPPEHSGHPGATSPLFVALLGENNDMHLPAFQQLRSFSCAFVAHVQVGAQMVFGRRGRQPVPFDFLPRSRIIYCAGGSNENPIR